jgi:Uncharacterised nucleotidyltransferase
VSAASFSPEFRLVAACCRPRTFADFDAVVAEAARGVWDADTLLTLARAHRVEGFVEDGLKRADVALPSAAAELLAARTAQSRLQMLRNAGEEIRMTALFAENGVEPLFVKGATLAMLAHGSLALKTSWDIDMLVTPAEIGTARTILHDAGYRLDSPGIDAPHLIDRYFERNKETSWTHAGRSTVLELHSALVDADGLLPGIGPDALTQSVEVARNCRVKTLARPELYAYLCVHGTSHRWERLKWLTDVATLVANGPETRGQFHDCACRLGAARSSRAALALCDQVLGIKLSIHTELRESGDRVTRRIVRSSIGALQRLGAPDPAPFERWTNEVARMRVQQLQVTGAHARLAMLHTQLSRAYTPVRLALPRWTLPFHALIWIPLRLATRPWRKFQAGDGKTASTP